MHSLCSSLSVILHASLQFALWQLPASAPCSVNSLWSWNPFHVLYPEAVRSVGPVQQQLPACTSKHPWAASLHSSSASPPLFVGASSSPGSLPRHCHSATNPASLPWTCIIPRGVCMQGWSCSWHFPFSLLHWYLQLLLNILVQMQGFRFRCWVQLSWAGTQADQGTVWKEELARESQCCFGELCWSLLVLEASVVKLVIFGVWVRNWGSDYKRVCFGAHPKLFCSSQPSGLLQKGLCCFCSQGETRAVQCSVLAVFVEHTKI